MYAATDVLHASPTFLYLFKCFVKSRRFKSDFYRFKTKIGEFFVYLVYLFHGLIFANDANFIVVLDAACLLLCVAIALTFVGGGALLDVLGRDFGGYGDLALCRLVYLRLYLGYLC